MIFQVVAVRKQSALTTSILVFIREIGSSENLVWVACVSCLLQHLANGGQRSYVGLVKLGFIPEKSP